MSKELRDKADILMRELQDALAPIKEELQNLKCSAKDNRILSK